MSGTEPPAARRGGVLRLALLAVIAVGAAAVLYVMFASSIKPGAGQGLERFARGGMEKLRVIEEPRAIPTVRITDEAGRMVSLADIPGEVVVVNLWATWCAPCIAEMPTLAALQQAYPGRIAVVPVSLDTDGKVPEAKAFLAKHPPLRFHHDPKWSVADAAKARAGLPTTIIYGRDRIERARVVGIAEWDSKEARGLFDALLAAP
jgi:thiol-disulfide isomerase/thioredoxin